MKLNKNTVKALAAAKAKFATKKVAVVKTVTKKLAKAAKITSNFWKKLRELGSYAFGVKFYNLRGKDYSSQELVDWNKTKGAPQRMALLTWGNCGILHNIVTAKGNVIRVNAGQGFDLGNLKCSWKLIPINAAIKLVQKQGKRQTKFNYDNRTFSGWQLQQSEAHYGVFTDGKSLFECEARRIPGKNKEQAKHVWSLG